MSTSGTHGPWLRHLARTCLHFHHETLTVADAFLVALVLVIASALLIAFLSASAPSLG